MAKKVKTPETETFTPDAVAPGDFVTLHCPPGSTVPFKVGDALSQSEKGEATSKVIRIEGNDIIVGALRAGDFDIQFECPGSSEKVSSQFRIVPLKKEEMPEASAPLAPIEFAYPLWFWIVVATALLAIVGIAWKIYRKLSRKLRPAPKIPEPRTLNPQEAYGQFLTEARRAKVVEKEDLASLQFLYGQGYERLRKFLEFPYELKTLIDTTREFLGTLRAAAPQIGLPLVSVDAVDALLTSADRVRFAKAQPPIEERRLFFKRLEELYVALKKPDKSTVLEDDA